MGKRKGGAEREGAQRPIPTNKSKTTHATCRQRPKSRPRLESQKPEAREPERQRPQSRSQIPPHMPAARNEVHSRRRRIVGGEEQRKKPSRENKIMFNFIRHTSQRNPILPAKPTTVSKRSNVKKDTSGTNSTGPAINIPVGSLLIVKSESLFSPLRFESKPRTETKSKFRMPTPAQLTSSLCGKPNERAGLTKMGEGRVKKLEVEAKMPVETGECQDDPELHTAAEDFVRLRRYTNLRSRRRGSALWCNSLGVVMDSKRKPAADRPMNFSSISRCSVFRSQLDDAWCKLRKLGLNACR